MGRVQSIAHKEKCYCMLFRWRTKCKISFELGMEMDIYRTVSLLLLETFLFVPILILCPASIQGYTPFQM